MPRRPTPTVSCLIFGLLLLWAVSTPAHAAAPYYCLEDYKPIGTPLQKVPIAVITTTRRNATSTATASNSTATSGQVARQCAAACDASPACSGFRAVGHDVRNAPASCELLANSTQSLPTALALQSPDEPWPLVNANLTVADNISLRSVSWMCWRQQQDWDDFGSATHQLIVSGRIGGDGPPPSHEDWCAFGVDVAGTNLRRDTINITRPAQCDTICKNTTGCVFWIFVASQPEQIQFQPARNCFAKADPSRGQNGWTGKPKGDIWQADSQVTCFSSLNDWRYLGLVLSPSIKTIQFSGRYFTVYPERVTWSEAAATCKQLPNGQLAILDSQGLLDTVSRDLLDTLPFQTGVRSAWVGLTGTNSAYNPSAANMSALTAGGEDADITRKVVQQRQPTEVTGPPTESTLRWTTGAAVAPGMLRRPDTLTQLWTVHDVVWSQQFVPESARDVCGRLMVQLPSTGGAVGAAGAAALNPASVLPGVWYYDCQKPAAFICQSSSAPTEPMSGREVTPSLAAVAEGVARSDSGGGQQPWKTALAVILPVLAVTLLAWQVFHVYSRKISRLPELVRQQRKRALGQPRAGRMSVVMTDIQGFTRLMQGHADQTTQALLLHNNLIKHAVYDNVGWVVEQEGDSFSVVFHDPEDACAFTLQVQQALLQQTWPPDVKYNDCWERASLLDCRTASQRHHDAPHASTDSPTAGAASMLPGGAGDPTSPRNNGSFSWQDEDADAAAAERQASSCSLGPRLASLGQQLLSLTPAGCRSSSFTVGGGVNNNNSGSGSGAAGGRLGHRRSHSLDGSPRSSLDTQQQQQRPLGEGQEDMEGVDAYKQHGPSQGLERTVSSTSGRSSRRSSDGAALAARAAALGLVDASGASVVSSRSAFAASSPGHARQLSVASEDARGFWGGWGKGEHNNSGAGRLGGAASGGSYSTAGAPLSSSKKSMLGGSRPRNLWLFQQLLSPRSHEPQKQLFNGLRVRMGVVTGVVQRGQDLKASELYRHAQEVSNAAQGGQVLLCEATFTAVKEALWRLGAVRANGLDYDLLLASKSAQHGPARLRRSSSGAGGDGCGCLGMLPGGNPRSDASTISGGSQLGSSSNGPDLALALDMGAYEVLSPGDPATYAGGRNSSSSDGAACVQLWTRELGDRLVQQYEQYIQHQITRHSSLGAEDEDNSFDEEAPYMVSAGAHGQHQQQQHHHQPGGLRQSSADRAGRGLQSTSKSFGGGGGDAAVSGTHRMRSLHSQQSQQHHHHQQDHHRQHQHSVVGRSASMTMGWGQVASSLFGVGTVPAASMGGGTAGGSMIESHSSQLVADRHALQLGYCSISAVMRRTVRLYQVVAPGLAGRAALFGSQLDIPHNWRMLDPPYFSAPGLSSASFEAAAAAEAAGGDGAAAGGDALQQQMRQRVPGRTSSEVSAWQQRIPGRTSSEVHPLPQQQSLGLQQQRSSSAHEAGMLSILQQQQQQQQDAAPSTTPQLSVSATGAAAADGTGSTSKPGGLPRPNSSPFLDAAQHSLDSSEGAGGRRSCDGCVQQQSPAGDDGDAVAAATAAISTLAHAGGQDGAALPELQPPPGAAGGAGGVVTRLAPGRLSSSASPQPQQQWQQQQQLAQPTSPLTPASPATAGGGMAPSQSLLLLRAASLHLGIAPLMLLAATSNDNSNRRISGSGSVVGGGSGGQRQRGVSAAGPARALFPPVTILFAAVEGAGELLRHPALARSVHAMVHHLMLQLLRAFPGSYLVRAQQGDLKYMLAFTHPAAAVSWGLTLQEASLYQPYPQSVLGLGSFGVQLDVGGRLVFRGPRFKMGLAEGTPKIVMPDHLGRADFHGSFVNLAARYAVVAAQGGQLVTDADTARGVLQHWRMCGHNNHNSSSCSYSPYAGGRAVVEGAPAGAATAAATAGAGERAARLSSSGDGGASGLRVGAGVADGAANNALVPERSSGSHIMVIQPPSNDAAGACSSTATPFAAATADVPVECCWLGSFLFKGNPSPVSIVSFTPSVLSGRQYAPAAGASSKGVRVLQRVGVMDRTVVPLPAAVEGFGPWEAVGGGAGEEGSTTG